MSEWSETRVRLLATLASEGWTASQIAKKLCTTRNAIIGKLDRLGVKLKSLVTGSSGLPRPPRQYERRYPPIIESSILQSQPYTEPLVAEPTEIAGPFRPLTLMDLKHDSCRWPINDGNPFYFCGKPRETGPYCVEHMRLAHGLKHKS